MSKDRTKSKSIYRMPGKLWKLLKKHLPKEPKIRKRGRPRVNNRDVLDGIWHILWTGSQWKSIEKEWFNVSSSVLHERFQTWQTQGLFEKLFKKMVKYYARECKIGWKWQSIDSMMSPSPLGGSQTGKNPTDRGKLGSKIHLLVDERGAPIAIFVTGANEHDKWSADDLIVHIVAKRPHSEQHFCADKGYDYEDVHQFVGGEITLSISSTGAGVMSLKKNVLFQVKKASRRDAGLSKEPLAGYPNAVVLPHAGVKSRRTGLPLFIWLALRSCSTS